MSRYSSFIPVIGAEPMGRKICIDNPTQGRFYDEEAKRQAEQSHLASSNAKLVCDGPVCFRRTCFTLMAVSIGTAGFAGLLWYRTRGFYMELHKGFQKSKRAELAFEASQEEHHEDDASQKNSKSNHKH